MTTNTSLKMCVVQILRQMCIDCCSYLPTQYYTTLQITRCISPNMNEFFSQTHLASVDLRSKISSMHSYSLKSLTRRDTNLHREPQPTASLSACPAHILQEHARHAALEPAFAARPVQTIQVLTGARWVFSKARPGKLSMSQRPPVAQSRPPHWSPSRDRILGAASLSWDREGALSLFASVLQAQAPCHAAAVDAQVLRGKSLRATSLRISERRAAS